MIVTLLSLLAVAAWPCWLFVSWLNEDDEITYLEDERGEVRELVLVRDPAAQARQNWAWDFDKEVDAA